MIYSFEPVLFMSTTRVNKYRKLPVIIDAIRWDGTNTDDVFSFCSGADLSHQIRPFSLNHAEHETIQWLIIKTLEGAMKAEINDFIIKGINGEFYPCKPNIFHKTYEMIHESSEDQTGNLW